MYNSSVYSSHSSSSLSSMHLIHSSVPSILQNVGYLELILGPMYSGKTSALIELKKQYSFTKLKVCVINYAEDTRYDNTKLSTHDKVMIDCFNTLVLSDLQLDEFASQYDVFLINEGQFFPDLFDCVKWLVDEKKRIVHISGLDGDFQRNGFEQMMKLIPYADTVVKKYSICKNCENGTKALFSHRLSGEKQVKVIGADNYIPLCRKCYLDMTSTQIEETNENMNEHNKI